MRVLLCNIPSCVDGAGIYVGIKIGDLDSREGERLIAHVDQTHDRGMWSSRLGSVMFVSVLQSQLPLPSGRARSSLSRSRALVI